MELAKAQTGDVNTDQVRALFGLFVAKHHPQLERYCEKQSRGTDSAEDIAQEAWATAWRRLNSFEGRSKLMTWVISIAFNHCRSSYSKKADILTEEGVLSPTDEATSALRYLTAQERAEVLRTACATLPQLEQDAIFLKYVHDKSYREISDMLKLQQASGARGLLVRSKRHLGQELRRLFQAMSVDSEFVRTASYPSG